MSGRATCLVACLLLVSIHFDGGIWIAHRRCAATGSVIPAFGIVWCSFNQITLPNDVELTFDTALAVTSFSDPSPQARRHAGDRNALW